MNERIRSLAEQARKHFPKTETSGEFWTFDEQKFAELIVRECVDVALDRKKWVEDQEVFDPRDEHWNQARIQQSQHIVNKIREHFGVEL